MDDIVDMLKLEHQSEAWAEYCASCNDDGEYDYDAVEDDLEAFGMHITYQP